MYESPIELIYTPMMVQFEDEVMKAVQNVGIDVNKEELIKALMYDREQYNKGFADAVKRVEERLRWIPVDERLPDTDKYVLLSFKNFSVPVIGRYEEDEEGGAFYAGDDDVPLVAQDMIVNAWMKLPERYNPKVCINEECPYNTKGDCAAAEGCGGYEEA